MTELRTAAQQAREVLRHAVDELSRCGRAMAILPCTDAINALEAALEQPEQKPVADRAAFERHAKSLGYSVDPDTRAGRAGGYWSSHTHLMWQTWQAALEQPEQEPVAWNSVGATSLEFETECLDGTRFLNVAEMPSHAVRWRIVAPPRREWRGLSEEEIDGLYRRAGLEAYLIYPRDGMVQYDCERQFDAYARAIEAKLKELNHHE